MDGGSNAGTSYCAPDTHGKRSRGKRGKTTVTHTRQKKASFGKRSGVCLGSKTTGAIGLRFHL